MLRLKIMQIILARNRSFFEKNYDIFNVIMFPCAARYQERSYLADVANQILHFMKLNVFNSMEIGFV